MLHIASILEKLKDTREAEILMQMEAAYENIAHQQEIWYEKSGFTCVEGCGECCRNFEPDLLESEALYMAAWILENQPEVAQKVLNGKFPYPDNSGCLFWDENNPYHCTIYFGRNSMCRFFGGCGFRSKEGETLWKPCKFYPIEKLQQKNPPLEHRQYNKQEILEIFGILPPVMTNLMEDIVSLNTDTKETRVIKECLPDAIRRLQWICSLNQ